MDKEPETYQELILQKRCVDLLGYYNMERSELDKIYNFFMNHTDGVADGNNNGIILKYKKGNETKQKIVNCTLFNPTIDGLKMTLDKLTIYPHYIARHSSIEW